MEKGHLHPVKSLIIQITRRIVTHPLLPPSAAKVMEVLQPTHITSQDEVPSNPVAYIWNLLST